MLKRGLKLGLEALWVGGLLISHNDAFIIAREGSLGKQLLLGNSFTGFVRDLIYQIE